MLELYGLLQSMQQQTKDICIGRMVEHCIKMLNLYNDCLDDIFIWLVYFQPTPKKVNQAFCLSRFRKKHTQLAWTLVHIMNAMHVVGHLHNDIFLDNILFYFLKDESRVYIGVCDWSMTIISTESMKSLYTFTFASDKDEALRRKR